MGKYIPVTLNNITALEFQSSLPQGKVALVCEGGGQRGIFTAGVLDEFMRSQFDPFDLLLGVSAGAQNLSALLVDKGGTPAESLTVIPPITNSLIRFVLFVGGIYSILTGI